ncbi:MAG: penicillin-binding protein [Thiopseudomonas sp.]
MTSPVDAITLNALKIAFSYMPNAIEVTRYEYGDNFQRVLNHITAVKEVLLTHGIDPDEVYGEVNPDDSPNSMY